ncbi:FAD-binding protein [Desulfothermus naphthae]
MIVTAWNLKHNIEILSFDTVIAGTGFSGLEAAFGAIGVKGVKKIALISLRDGLSGSSFLNHNKQVGIQMPLTEKEKKNFINRAIEIAYPGYIDRKLVNILMEDAEERLLEIQNLGIDFIVDNKGNLTKFKGCFLPEQNSAVVILNLKSAFSKLFNRIKDKVCFFPDVCILKIFVDKKEKRIIGLICFDIKKNKFLAIKTKSLVMATSGVVSLFPYNISWMHPFCGITMGVLKDASVNLVNEGFIQMLWLKTTTLDFFSYSNFKQTNLAIEWEKQKISLPFEYFNLIDIRDSHCPIGYGTQDFKLDKFLLQFITKKGVKLIDKNRGFFIRPFAQAQNGGAKIDEHGMSSIRGLFACGECASGMHGANRIGGAMILSCLVFGFRAGKYAAIFSKENKFLSDKIFTNLVNDFLDEIKCLNSQDNHRRIDISKSLLLGEKEELIKIRENIHKELEAQQAYIERLKLMSLLTVVEGRLKGLN